MEWMPVKGLEDMKLWAVVPGDRPRRVTFSSLLFCRRVNSFQPNLNPFEHIENQPIRCGFPCMDLR